MVFAIDFHKYGSCVYNQTSVETFKKSDPNMSQDNPQQPLPTIRVNDALPSLYVDCSMCATRGDDMVFVRLMTLTPEGVKEQVRFFVSTTNFKAMIDGFCSQLNHYPTAPAGRLSQRK